MTGFVHGVFLSLSISPFICRFKQLEYTNYASSAFRNLENKKIYKTHISKDIIFTEIKREKPKSMIPTRRHYEQALDSLKPPCLLS